MEDTSKHSAPQLDPRIEVGGGGGSGGLGDRGPGRGGGGQESEDLVIPLDKVAYNAVFTTAYFCGKGPDMQDTFPSNPDSLLRKEVKGAENVFVYFKGYRNPLKPEEQISWACRVDITNHKFEGQMGIAFETSSGVYAMRFEDFITRIADDVQNKEKFQEVCNRLYPGKYKFESSTSKPSESKAGKKTKADGQGQKRRSGESDAAGSPAGARAESKASESRGSEEKQGKRNKKALEITTEPPDEGNEQFEKMKTISNVKQGREAGTFPSEIEVIMDQFTKAINELVDKQTTVSQAKRARMAGIAVFAVCNLFDAAFGGSLTDAKDFFYSAQLCEHVLTLEGSTFSSLQGFFDRLFEYLKTHKAEVNQLKSILGKFAQGEARSAKKRKKAEKSDDEMSASGSDDGIELEYFCYIRELSRSLLNTMHHIQQSLATHFASKTIEFCLRSADEGSHQAIHQASGQDSAPENNLFDLFSLLKRVNAVINDYKGATDEDLNAYFSSIKFIPKDLDSLLEESGVCKKEEVDKMKAVLGKLQSSVLDNTVSAKTFNGKTREWLVCIESLKHEVDIPSKEELLKFLMEIYKEDPHGPTRYRDAMAHIRQLATEGGSGQARKAKKSPAAKRAPAPGSAQPDPAQPDPAQPDPAQPGAEGGGDGGQGGNAEEVRPAAKRPILRVLRELDLGHTPEKDGDFVPPGEGREKREPKQRTVFKPTVRPDKTAQTKISGFDIENLSQCSRESPLEGVWGPCFRQIDLCGQEHDLPKPEVGICRKLGVTKLKCTGLHKINLYVGEFMFIESQYLELNEDPDVVYKLCLIEPKLIFAEKPAVTSIFCCVGQFQLKEVMFMFDGTQKGQNRILQHARYDKMKSVMCPPPIVPGTEQGKRVGQDGKIIYPAGAKKRARASDADDAGEAAAGGGLQTGSTFANLKNLQSVISSVKGMKSGGKNRSFCPTFHNQYVRPLRPEKVPADEIVDIFHSGANSEIRLPYPGFDILDRDEEIQTAVRVVPGVLRLIHGDLLITSSCSLPIRYMFFANPLSGMLNKYLQRMRFDDAVESSDAKQKPVFLDEVWKCIAAKVKAVESEDKPVEGQAAGESGAMGEGGASGEGGSAKETDSKSRKEIDVSSALELANNFSNATQFFPFVYLILETDYEYPFSRDNKDLIKSMNDFLIVAIPCDLPVNYFVFDLVQRLLLQIQENDRRRLFGPIDLMSRYEAGSVSTVEMTFGDLLASCSVARTVGNPYNTFRREISKRHNIHVNDMRIITIGELCHNPLNPFEHFDGICKIGESLKGKQLRELFREGRMKKAHAPFRGDLFGAREPICHCMFKRLEDGGLMEDNHYVYYLMPGVSEYDMNDCLNARSSIVFARNVLTHETYKVHCLPIEKPGRSAYRVPSMQAPPESGEGASGGASSGGAPSGSAPEQPSVAPSGAPSGAPPT